MEADRRNFFMMSVEIRILTAVLTRISGRAIEERFSAHNADISGLQYGILRSLSHESSTLSELSRKFMLDPSTLVPVIATLERKGLIARGRDTHDRRRWSISIAPKGAQLLRDVPVVHEDDVLFQCLERMGDEKAAALRELLREVVHGLPDGDEMLNSVTSRLYTLQDGEQTGEAAPEHCLPQQTQEMHEVDEVGDEDVRAHEHHHMIERTTRRRRTRNR
jgi:DNA-binding MarR family transcriptional regulator